MAHHTIIYGHICGAFGRVGDDYYKLHELNKNIINSLPENDDSEYPWINRSMFSIPNKQGVFRDQVITFGASYKTLEYNWHIWLEKFETILKQLYWYDVTIHASFEVFGDYTYEWLIKVDQAHNNWFKEIPEPALNWEYESDGPRTFLDRLHKNKYE